MSATEIAYALSPGARPRRGARGTTWRVPCPSHSDRHPSLDITDANGLTLLICRAGCTQREIIDVLRVRGLWRDGTPSHGREPLYLKPAKEPREIPSCCLRPVGRPACEHWQRFRQDWFLAELFHNLRDAVAELRAKAAAGLDFSCEPRSIAKPLTTDELRDGLLFAIEFGAIVPAEIDKDVATRAIDRICAEVAGR
jgi:hypothetical protein